MAENIHPDLVKFTVDISTLNPDPKNTRTHDERNIEAIKSSLTKFGQRLPIIVQRSGSIVRAGNGRLQAARELGWTKIAAVVVDDSDADATAYSILDNRTAELAEWNVDILKVELAELQVGGLNLESLGFNGQDLDKLMGPKEGLTDDDAVPEPPKEAITKPGDLWILGNHRLLCGDSTKAGDVEKLMGGGHQGLDGIH